MTKNVFINTNKELIFYGYKFESICSYFGFEGSVKGKFKNAVLKDRGLYFLKRYDKLDEFNEIKENKYDIESMEEV